MDGAKPFVSVLATVTHGRRAVAVLRWRWQLPLGRRWLYRAQVVVRDSRRGWRPVWSSRLVNPHLAGGDKLELSAPRGKRAPILASDGQPIVSSRAIVDVGIEPSRVRNLPSLLRTLHTLLGVQERPLARAVRAAPANEFVPVITLRRPDYEAVRARIHPLPGTVFRTGTLPLAATRAFARSLLGTSGPATAQIVSASHGRLRPGDIVGLSGLEQAYDDRLAGRPGLLVQAVRHNGEGGRLTLYASAAHPGRPLRTTLELKAQEAADTALTGIKQPSALVALRISTGSLIASAVGPNPGGYDTALLGEYPPGSTFKVITALALLERGLKPNSTINCPRELTVDGKQFHNAEQEALGPASFSEDFARSCNTAFASLARRVTGKTLPATARSLGIGRAADLGTPAFTGSVPQPSGPVELAADTFGQGRILVSPLTMAGVAAAIARGRWLSPRLVIHAHASPRLTGPRLPPRPLAALRELMRKVVTSGTGTALANQPGGPVYGKTGTAETHIRDGPRTDAWFIGYQDDIAFAALVANTHNGFGGTLAAPIIARFLTNLNH
jgi:cell division protein FtsI/penicillin-binding protein 2